MNERELAKFASWELDPDFPVDLARDIAILVLDVDGVLTDGGLYYNDEGLALKRFSVQDGAGIKMAQHCGIEVVIITGMESGAVERRAEVLGIDGVYCGVRDKLSCLEQILQERSLEWRQAAYVGDDWIDFSVLSRVGLALSVSNAQPEIKAASHYVSELGGGNGAVRLLVRHILAAQGKLVELLREFAK